MKKNKSLGFTLIELLAVIVILAVIAIIITPMIANTINNVKAGAIKASVYSIAHSSKQYCVNKQATDGKFQEKSYELNKDNATLIGFTYNASLTGIISIYSDCSVAVKATDGTYYASKDANSDTIAYGLKPSDFDPTTIMISTNPSCFVTSDNGDNTLSITGFTCSDTNITIPGSINGHYITKIGSIGSGAEVPVFKNLTSVNLILMKKLIIIGDYSFSNITDNGNNIANLNITDLPALTTIGIQAFNNSGIKNLTLNNLPALTTIYNYAFEGDTLSTININNLSSIEFFGASSFYSINLESLTLKNMPKLGDFNGTEFEIPRNNNMSLTLDNLPSLTKLDTWNSYRLSSITLSNLPNLKTIARMYHEQLSSLTLSDLPELTTIDSFQGTTFTDLVIKDLPKLTTITANSFCSCPNLKNVTLSNLPMLTEISMYTFAGDQIQNLNLSGLNSLVRIGSQAFAENKISSLTLSNLPALVSIDSGAFVSNMIKNINLSSLPNLSAIAAGSFYGNPIESISLKDLPKLTTIESGAFIRTKATDDDSNCAATYTFDNLPSVAAYNSSNHTGLGVGAFANVDACASVEPTVIFKNTISDPLRNYSFAVQQN